MSRSKPFVTPVLVVSALQLVVSGAAAAAELKQPLTLSAPGLPIEASPNAVSPPGSTNTCSNLNAPTGTVHTARLVVRDTVRPDVGPYSVRLSGYATDPASSASDRYAPFLITASPGDSLRFDLIDQLAPSEEMGGVVNIHTHGLIVNPRPCTPLSDYIFVEDQPGSTTSYRVDIPATLPGAQFSSSTGPVPYPSGLNWFHAHVHGKTSDDLLAGQSGFLYVGNLEQDLLSRSSPDSPGTQALENSDTLYLGMREIQLAVPPGALPDKVSPGQPAQELAGLSYDRNACLAYADPPIPLPLAFSGPGYCGHHFVYANGKVDQTHDTVWMFTVNGQAFPTITMQPGRNQVWRIANFSPNVSYVLELDDDATGKAQEFDALALDGLAAGTSPADATTMNVGVPLTHLLMMPASRAEILLLNAGSASGHTFTLRTTGITTGAGGDYWPRIDLAHVVMPPATAAPAGAAASIADVKLPMPMMAPPAVAPTPAISAVTPANCVTLPPGQATRRQITFSIDSTGANFEIGSQVVNPLGIPIPGTAIPSQTFPMSAMLTPHALPHVCAKLGTTEVWEVINNSGQLHNFHIHENKFRLARQSDPGVPPNLVPFQDPSNLVAQYEPEATGTSPINNVDVWHDVFPLPPYGGRIFVTVPFQSVAQVGDFVFHCHILAHEDLGMMAPIQVYDPGTFSSAEQAAADQASLGRHPVCTASAKGGMAGSKMAMGPSKAMLASMDALMDSISD